MPIGKEESIPLQLALIRLLNLFKTLGSGNMTLVFFAINGRLYNFGAVTSIWLNQDLALESPQGES